MSHKSSQKRRAFFSSIASVGLIASAFAQARESTWDPGSSGFAWNSTGNWLGPSGQWPDDWYDKAVLPTKGTLADPILTHDVQGSAGGALGQLVFNSAGWTLQNEPGGDYTMYLDSVQYQYPPGQSLFGYNAIYSLGAGTNTIQPKLAFNVAGQNVYSGAANTLVLEKLSGSYAFVVSCVDPTGDNGSIRLAGDNSSLTSAFLIRQGALVVTNGLALGSSSTAIAFGDNYTANPGGVPAKASLLTDAAVAVSKNLVVTNLADHLVDALIGGKQTSGASQFGGSLQLNRTAMLTSANTDGNAVSFTGAISGVAGIIKTGAGTVNLNAANTYAGTTQVNQGRLLVNGFHSGGGAYTVASGATLGGTGTIAAHITVLPGGLLAPGSSIESLDVSGNVNLQGTLKIEMSGAGSGASDRLNVNGMLDISSARLDIDAISPLDDPAHVLASYSSLSGPIASVIDLPAGYTINYQYRGQNLIAIEIPEPVSFAVMVLGVALLSARRNSQWRI